MTRTTGERPKRYFGLGLAGAKNNKTSVAVLDWYPARDKALVTALFDRLEGDAALLETLASARGKGARLRSLGVNVPATLPPCVTCRRRVCPMPARCNVPAVRWMRDERPLGSQGEADSQLTPYTQRPVELWLRGEVLPSLDPRARVEIDEALGGSRAPLTSRMVFLRRHLPDVLGKVEIREVWPKLVIATLEGVVARKAERIAPPRAQWHAYRQLEEGQDARESLLRVLSAELRISINQREHRSLAQSLTAFDAMVCAVGAWLEDRQLTHRPPPGFPVASGWVAVPLARV